MHALKDYQFVGTQSLHQIKSNNVKWFVLLTSN